MLQLRYNDWSDDVKKKWGTLGSHPLTFPLPKHSHPQTTPFERKLSVEISPSVGSTRQAVGPEAI